jgi:uncharacterized protein YkwD
MTTKTTHTLLLVAALALTACGGGGGGGDTAAPVTPIDTTPPAPLVFVDTRPAQTSVPAPTYTSAVSLDAFNQLNQYRQAAGLGLLKQSPQLDVAAQSHANYNSLNDNRGHGETAGVAGFTGANSSSRAAAAGYVGSLSEVAAIGGFKGSEYIDFLMGAPYHRMVMLKYQPTDVGIGDNAEFPANIVIDMANKSGLEQGAPNTPAAVWPADQMTDVQTSGCCEAPDPAPELNGAAWGYPVSIQTHERKKLVVTSFVLTDASGAVIMTKLLDYKNDPILRDTYFANYVAFLLPHKPLAVNSRYTATFAGTIDGVAHTRTWSFTTGTRTLN